MAAAYMRHRLPRGGPAHVVVDSAGTLGITGAPASAEAIAALAELGIDLATHRSQALEETTLRSSDLVICMDRGHLETLARLYPGGRDRRLLVRAFEQAPSPAADPPDLDDPVGQPLAVFRAQLRTLQLCLDHLALYLRHTPAP